MDRFINYFHSFSFQDFKTKVDLWRDLEFIQLDSGEEYYNSQQILTDGIFVSHSFFTRKMEKKGAFPKENYWIFHLQNSGDAPLFINSKFIKKNEITIHKPHSDFKTINHNNHSSYAVGIKEEVFEILCEMYQIDNILKKLKTKESIVVEENSFLMLKDLIATLFKDIKLYNSYQLVNLRVFKIVSTLISIIFFSSKLIRENSKHNKVLQNSLEFIENHRYKPIGINDLVEGLNFSQRTLHYNFQKVYGMSTKKYIKAHKLNLIKLELEKSDRSNTTIAQVANRYGFWHMGQFSKDYKELFHTNPLDTLKNSNIKK